MRKLLLALGLLSILSMPVGAMPHKDKKIFLSPLHSASVGVSANKQLSSANEQFSSANEHLSSANEHLSSANEQLSFSNKQIYFPLLDNRQRHFTVYSDNGSVIVVKNGNVANKISAYSSADDPADSPLGRYAIDDEIARRRFSSVGEMAEIAETAVFKQSATAPDEMAKYRWHSLKLADDTRNQFSSIAISEKKSNETDEKVNVKTIKKDEYGNSLIVEREDRPGVYYLFGGVSEDGKPIFNRMKESQLIIHGLKEPKNIVSSFLHGVIQDILFGWADELEAYFRSFGKGKYESEVKKVRERYQAHQVHNSWSYNIGNYATLAIPIGMWLKGSAKIGVHGGAAALAKAKKGELNALAKIAYRKKKFKETTGSKIFRKSDAAKIAKLNVAVGAVAGAGYSNDEPALGAVIGGLAGGAIGGVLGGGKLILGNIPLKRKLSNNDYRIRNEVEEHFRLNQSEFDAISSKGINDINVLNRLVLKKGILNNNPDVSEVINRVVKLKNDTGKALDSYRQAMPGISQDELKKLVRGKDAEVAFFRRVAIDPTEKKDIYGNNVDNFLGSLDWAFGNSAKKNGNKTMSVYDFDLFFQTRIDKLWDVNGKLLNKSDDFVQGLQELVHKIETPRAEKMGVLSKFTQLKEDYVLLQVLPDAASVSRLRVNPYRQSTTEEIGYLLKRRATLFERMEREEILTRVVPLTEDSLLKMLYGMPSQSTRLLFKTKDVLAN